MKRVLLLTLFGVCLSPLYAKDELVVKTTKNWFFDTKGDQSFSVEFPSTSNTESHLADFDRDGKMEICEIDRTSDLIKWTWKSSSDNLNWNVIAEIKFGIPKSDQTVVGDFNGDKRVDLAIFRTSDNSPYGTWYIDFSPCDGKFEAKGVFGLKGDIPLSGDFNGDGVDDIAVYRPSTFSWYSAISYIDGYPNFDGNIAINGLEFGQQGNIPFVGDFNGDGYSDMAIYSKEEHKVYINFHDFRKPQFERLANANGKGVADQTLAITPTGILAIMAGDINNSRPMTLPLAKKSEIGEECYLRHGWTCVFDDALDVDKWVQAILAAGINTLENHSWMRAHEEIKGKGESWNTYVGDDRLWTSKAKMKEKIEKFRQVGGRSICYTGIYAGTPAFAAKYPKWAMYESGTSNMITYGGKYLYLMATSEQVNEPYILDGTTFKNWNDYFVDQARQAQQEFDWDGWRWDWYGLPANYDNPTFSGSGNFSEEMAPLTKRLDVAVKTIREDCTTTALQLPGANDDIPNQHTAMVVDHQFLELWPFSPGNCYSNLYQAIYKAKSLYPDKPVFANFYPPQEMNLKTGWPQINIDYQFAVCLSAGGYPAAQVVDGVASFTDPVPFHGVTYPKNILERIKAWNSYVEAYAPFYYFSNRVYVITDLINAETTISNGGNGTVAYVKRRYDKRTHQNDALIVNLINFGPTTDLRWEQINSTPTYKSPTVTFSLPEGFVPANAYRLTIDGREQISYTIDNNKLTCNVALLDLFATIVITSQQMTEIAPAPITNTIAFPDLTFEYDTHGRSLLETEQKNIILMDNDEPLEISNIFNEKLTTWKKIEDGVNDNSAIRITSGQITFTSSNKQAFRVPIRDFNRFKISIRANNSKSTYFGFRLLKPSENSPVWETKDIHYRVGGVQIGVMTQIPITTTKPVSGEWNVYERDMYQDAIQTFGPEWENAVVVAVHYGPTDTGTTDYDNLHFFGNGYNSLESTEILSLRPFFEGNFLVLDTSMLSQGEDYLLTLSSSTGVELLKERFKTGHVFFRSTLSCEQGAYCLQLINLSNKNTYTTKLIK